MALNVLHRVLRERLIIHIEFLCQLLDKLPRDILNRVRHLTCLLDLLVTIHHDLAFLEVELAEINPIPGGVTKTSVLNMQFPPVGEDSLTLRGGQLVEHRLKQVHLLIDSDHLPTHLASILLSDELPSRVKE